MQRTTALFQRQPSILWKRRLLLALPFLIAAVALAVRLYGLDWDQGNLFHPDERSIYLRADCMYLTLASDPGWLDCANPDFPLDSPGVPGLGAFFDADRSPLNPHWFPLGSVLIYVLVVARALMEPFMDTVGLSDLATAGRTLTALADAGSVLLLFVLGQRLYGRVVGLLAAGLGAFTAATIQLAHFYRPEPFVILLALASFWFMLNVAERGRWRDHWLLGVMVGLSFAVKPTSVHLLAPLAVTYAVAAWRTWSFYRLMVPWVAVLTVVAQGLAAGAVAVGVFAVLEPYAFMDFAKFAGDLGWETRVARTAGLMPYTLQYVGAPRGLYELNQTTVWALGLPLGLVAWGGLLLTILRSRRKPLLGDLLLLSWVLAIFLTAALFEVKFLRYVAPILPVMVLLGSRWLVAGHGWAIQRSAILGKAAITAVAFVVLATAFYGLAFTTIYSQPHPAVQASQWVNEQAPDGATILTDNHWDEGFPDLGRHAVSQLPMYERDGPEKMESLARRLEAADYLMIYSNRPFGSIARLPERYPLSSRYYRLLFAGGLGYGLEQAFTRYPSLLGLSFTHDPFTRATVARPPTLPGADPRGVALGLGYADENVTNYDRPLVLVFRNQEHLTASTLLRKIAPGLLGQDPLIGDGPASLEQESGSPAYYPGNRQLPQARASVLSVPNQVQGTAEGLLLTEEAWAVQRQGGTWTGLFSESGIVSRAPWLIWLLLVEAVGLAALPLAVAVFRWLPDRGVALAKPLGILAVAWLSWLGASAGWWHFTRWSVLGALLALALVSGLLLYRQRAFMIALVKQRWRYLLSVEALFLLAFFAFLAVRAANPDLWHPWRGGEKPMDLAYLTAVVKSTTMPPYDPWYAGGYINYYYFGHYIVAMLIKVTGIVPAVAYNLAVPLLFALTVTGAFAVGHSLAEALRGRRYPHLPGWSTVLAGLTAAALVSTLANLDGAAQLLQGGWRWLAGEGFTGFDFWRSSRLMPGQWSITEFPFWSFLFGDLHAHVIAIPFALLALGLALNLALSAGARLSWLGRLPALGFLSLAIGALAGINTWDVPAYALIAIVAGVVVLVARKGRIRPRHIAQWLCWTVLFGALAYALFLPFHLSYESPFDGIKASPQRTVFWQYVAIHGVLLFLVGSWVVVEAFRRFSLGMGRPPTDLSLGPGAAPAQTVRPSQPALVRRRWVATGMAIFGVVMLAVAGWETVAVLVAFVLLLVLLAAYWIRNRQRPEAPAHLLLLTFVGMAFAIGIGVDLVTMVNDIDRMNTVFKFYLNAWVLLGVASGVALWHLWATGSVRWGKGTPRASKIWTGLLVVLAIGSAIYPVFGTGARLADRFQPLPLTLDGAAYQQVALYVDPGPSGHGKEPNARYPLSADAEALEYMRQNIGGSPVVLEAVTTQYRWTPRVASYTGLPVVVGWEWHQTQQRNSYTNQVRQRISDVDTIYATADLSEAIQLLERYQVEYVYIGPVERLYYPATGLEKFEALVGKGLAVFFQSPQVTVYQVTSEAIGVPPL